MRTIATCFFIIAIMAGCGPGTDTDDDAGTEADAGTDAGDTDDVGTPPDLCQGACGSGTVCTELEDGTHKCRIPPPPPDPCEICGEGTECLRETCDDAERIMCVPLEGSPTCDLCDDGTVCVPNVCAGIHQCLSAEEAADESELEQDDCNGLCAAGLVCGEENGAPRCVASEVDEEAQADAGVDNDAGDGQDDAGSDAGADLNDCGGVCGTDTVCEDGQCVPAQEAAVDPCGGVCGTGSVCGEINGLPMCIPTTNPDSDAGTSDQSDGGTTASLCDGDPLCWNGKKFCIVSAPLAQDFDAPVPTGQSTNETTAGLYGDTYASHDAYMVGENIGWTVSASDRFSYEDGFLCKDFTGMNAGTYRFTLVSSYGKYLSTSCAAGTLLPLYQSGTDDYGLCPVDGNTAVSSYVWHHNEQVCDGIASDLSQYCESASGGWRFVAVYGG